MPNGQSGDSRASGAVARRRRPKLVCLPGGGQPSTDPKPGDYKPVFPHTWHECAPGCDGCQFCHGGLGWCTVCGGFEGQLLPDCPGFHPGEEALNACYKGNVMNLVTWRAYTAAGLVRKRGRWVAA